MEQKSHGSPSFINIAVLLLFAIVIAVASTATTYFFLGSKSSEQPPVIQAPIVPPVQTNIYPTASPTTQTTVPSDETANWNMYTNTKVGFTIKYPEQYSKPGLPTGPIGPDIYADGTEDDATIIFSDADPNGDSFNLTVSPFTGDVIEFVDYQKKNTFGSTDKPYVQYGSDVVVDGKKTLTYFTQSNAIRVYFTGKNHSFIFHAERSSDKEIKQILSTFKFIN